MQDGLARFWDEEDWDRTTFRPLSLEATLRGVMRTMMENNKMRRRSEPMGEENEVWGIDAVK